jgi:deoxyribose-phosphate aldolase
MALTAGGDFIKTSTGKGKTGATLPEFIVMC